MPAPIITHQIEDLELLPNLDDLCDCPMCEAHGLTVADHLFINSLGSEPCIAPCIE